MPRTGRQTKLIQEVHIAIVQNVRADVPVVQAAALEAQAKEEAQAEASAAPATAKERMAAKVRTPEGRALYARRKVIVEPVFGQIKEVRGFRRFLLRGLQKIRGEWSLVCLTHNLLKLWRYGCAPSTVS
jgi:hypothetical protein